MESISRLSWDISEKDEDEIIRFFLPRLKREVINSLKDMPLSCEEVDEFAQYWVGSVMPQRMFRIRREDFLALPEDRQFEFIMNEKGIWNRGIGSYSHMAGESIEPIIERVIDYSGLANILDIGCGDMHFLEEVKKRFGDKVNCVGSRIEYSPLEMVLNIDLL